MVVYDGLDFRQQACRGVECLDRTILTSWLCTCMTGHLSGAMENKGLNVFNTAFVLAKPETATDTDYERIEGVIAHEYFHNW